MNFDVLSTLGEICSLTAKELVRYEASRLFLRPPKPMDVLLLLSQDYDVGKRGKGEVQDSFRILRAPGSSIL